MKALTKLTASAVVLTLLAGACGSDGDSSSTATSAASSPSTTADSAAPASSASADTSDATEQSNAAPSEMKYDIGVTDDVIKLGLNVNLSGPFAAAAVQIVDAQQAYWEIVNDNGGVAGRQIELVILDSQYDVPQHIANYERLAGDGSDGVALITNSAGAAQSAAVAKQMIEDKIAAIPTAWYSGLAFPEIGQNYFEAYANLCFESMNAVEYMDSVHDIDTIAILSFPGEYGEDGAAGAVIAAEALGLEVVYDGVGAIVPGADQTPVVNALVAAKPDLVWSTVNATVFSEIFGAAVGQGMEAQWTGTWSTMSSQLFTTPIGPALDKYYTHSSYFSLWGTSTEPGMLALMEGMRAKRPDAAASDQYIIGWVQGMIAQQILEQAASNGDMTREGILKAGSEITVDLGGLAPNQTWTGEPNDFAVRGTFLYKIKSQEFDPSLKVTAEGAQTGFELLKGPFVGDIAANFDFTEPCFVS